MTGAWTSGPAYDPRSSGGVTVIDGSTFCVSGVGGEVWPDRAEGLFVRDTRLLSGWRLAVNGSIPQPLGTETPQPFSATFIGRVPPQSGHSDSTLMVVVRRYVGDGMREDIELHNLSASSCQVELTLDLDADFADLFEVKGGRVQPAAIGSAADGAGLRLWPERGDNTAALHVRAEGCTLDKRKMSWQVSLPARGTWSAVVEYVASFDGLELTPSHPRGFPLEETIPASRMQDWRAGGPAVTTGDGDLAAVLRQSVLDLGALRIFDPRHPERAVVAAGAPWFMALFGRDSLLTSWMVLPLDEQLALGTLQTLAAHQGRQENPLTEEQPGRILHEVRFGHATRSALGGTAYFGSIDATPLFVMLMAEVRRWGCGLDDVKALLPHADRALEWISHYGDQDGDGFVEYERMNPEGLLNQGWKDSFDGVNFADGTLAQGPIALAEVQGYVYAAYLARAELADEFDDHALAASLRDRAAKLKQDFNNAFWLPEKGYFAIALDGHKRPVDALASNMGHCLWTGIVDDDKAESVADHLLSPQMFSGWGIRTLASNMGAYNPMSYHNGSVWPHDNAICAAGLARYGFMRHAQRVVQALVDVSGHFGHRLPELLCGFDHGEFGSPIEYPTSCSPQAWASAAPLLAIRTLLRLDPVAAQAMLSYGPAVPRRYLPLTIERLRIGFAEVTLRIDNDGWQIDGLPDHFTVREPGRTMARTIASR